MVFGVFEYRFVRLTFKWRLTVREIVYKVYETYFVVPYFLSLFS